ncbi:hypothetical protein AO716_03275 [Arthrobacter sp. Edens01]|nr:hypothetical protein AO716_03275 [Arthrobacter sp. Edens01]
MFMKVTEFIDDSAIIQPKVQPKPFASRRIHERCQFCMVESKWMLPYIHSVCFQNHCSKNTAN